MYVLAGSGFLSAQLKNWEGRERGVFMLIKWCAISLLIRWGRRVPGKIVREFSGVSGDRRWIAERYFQSEVI